MATPHHGLRFGVFELDLESGELRKNGLKLKLQEQPLQVLAALLERPGEVVSREKLQQRLWADGTFVEFDHGLSTAVNRLRETLGDSAKSPRYVETVARRGYRFLGPVESLDGQGRAEPVIAPKRSGKRRWLPIAAALGVAAVAVGLWLTRAESPPDYKLTQLTWDTGLTTDPAISPDGKLVAYASDRAGGDNLDIWVQQVSGGEPRQLTTHEATDRAPSFSHDGSRIVFASERDGGGVYVVPVLGGHQTPVAKAICLYQQPRFSPDDKWIAYHDGFRIHIVPAGGGEPRALETGLAAASRPIWSPSGEHVLFLGSETPDGEKDWWVVPVEGGPAVKTGAYDVLRRAGLEWMHSLILRRTSLYSVWAPDGKHIVFSATMGGSDNLWRVPISPGSWKISGEPQRLSNGTGELQPSLAAGGRIVFSSQTKNQDIWALPIHTNQGKVTGSLKRVTTGLAEERFPTVSTDGRRMVFTSNRSGNFDVWLKDLQTGEEKPLTVTPEDERRAMISPDGSNVAFLRKSESGKDNDIHLLPLDAGTSKKIVEGIQSMLCWSFDGTRILHYDRRRPARWSTTAVVTGETVEVISHPKYNVYGAHLSPDDRWISFMLGDPNGWPLYMAPIRNGVAGPQSEWIRVQDGLGGFCWSPDMSLLYITSDYDGFFCIWARRLDRATGRPVGEAFSIRHLHGRLSNVNSGYGLTNDTLYRALRETTGNIWLAEPLE